MVDVTEDDDEFLQSLLRLGGDFERVARLAASDPRV